MIDDGYNLRTPEQIDLAYDLAGLGSRFLALLIDVVIQGVLTMAIVFAFGLGSALFARLAREWLGSTTTLATMIALSAMILLMFLVTWGYYVVFELVWNGQTPGKRVAGIRVLTMRGEPVTLVHTLVRNLLRIVDFLPTSYMIGAVCILMTRRSQRLGDLAAGTVVVRERREAVPRALPPLDPALALPPLLATAFTREDVSLARDYLIRVDTLAPARRQQLGDQIARRLRARLAEHGQAAPSDLTDDHLLAGVAGLRR